MSGARDDRYRARCQKRLLPQYPHFPAQFRGDPIEAPGERLGACAIRRDSRPLLVSSASG
jgi:hypothetical protein